jgi:hypothetical protein
MKLLDWIGDRNPQLMREWQGRFQPWNVVGAFSLSAIGQFIFLTDRFSKLPPQMYETHAYCTNGKAGNSSVGYSNVDFHCLKDAAGNNLVNWQLWWRDNFVFLTQCLVFTVIVAGVYLLISNLVYEERRGTLNFIRLSPCSNREILLGKLLGVPVLVYVALGVAMPLHLWAAVQGQVSLGLVVGLYGVGAASCFFFYSGALLWSLTTSVFGNLQPWAGTAFVGITVAGLLGATGYAVESPLTWVSAFSPTLLLNDVLAMSEPIRDRTWFKVPIYANSLSNTLFSMGYFAGWSYWVWQSLERRFRNSNATALSKAQSYGFTACLVGSLMGFAWQAHNSLSSSNYCFIVFVMGLVVMMMITPNRQTLQEWARYRRSVPHQERRSLRDDLLWGEKSPALVAVAVNLAIAVTLLILTASSIVSGFDIFLEPFLLAGVLLMLAAIFQVILMGRTAKPALWASSTLGILLVCPIVMVGIIGVASPLWLLTAMPWMAGYYSVSVMTMWTGLLGQLGVFALFTYQFTRQINRAGESGSKALLN